MVLLVTYVSAVKEKAASPRWHMLAGQGRGAWCSWGLVVQLRARFEACRPKSDQHFLRSVALLARAPLMADSSLARFATPFNTLVFVVCTVCSF